MGVSFDAELKDYVLQLSCCDKIIHNTNVSEFDLIFL